LNTAPVQHRTLLADPLFPVSSEVERLRSYYRDKLDNIDIARLRSLLDNESDRAIVILTGCILDDLLEYRISSVRREPAEVSSFASKIRTAYLSGIIDKLTAKQLDIVREMRNACAHSVFALSFQMPELADVAETLFGPPNGVVELVSKEHQRMRDAFANEVCVLMINLVYGSREYSVQWAREHFPAWFADLAPPRRKPDRNQ
jgi:hypothetical protein